MTKSKDNSVEGIMQRRSFLGAAISTAGVVFGQLNGVTDLQASDNVGMTFAEANASTVLGQKLIINDRAYSRWVPWDLAVDVPAEMEGYCWFSDANGHKWMLEPGKPVDPRFFGAVGNDATRDTRAFHAMAWWCSRGYSSQIDIHNAGDAYLIGDGLLSWLPNDTVKAEITGIRGFSGTNNGVAFVGVSNLTITGHGKPIIKRANSSCSLNTSSWLSWGILNFKRTGFIVTGMCFDGNRANQDHTSGLSTFVDVNNLIFGWGDCPYATVTFSRFTGSGTLHANADKAGDGIYFSSGIKHRKILWNQFANNGRMHITCERPRPTLNEDSPTYQSYGDIIRFNYFESPFRQDGGTMLADIDFEPWSNCSYADISDNHFKGMCKVSFGSAPNTTVQVVRGLKINRNTFDRRGSKNADTSAFCINVSAGFANARVSLATCVRVYEGIEVCDNKFYNDKAVVAPLILLKTAVFKELQIKRNHNQAAGKVGVGAFLEFAQAWLEGNCVVEGNSCGLIANGIYMASWIDPTSKGYTVGPVYLKIHDNSGVGTGVGIRGTLPAFPTGSRVILMDNSFPDQAAHFNLDPAAFLGVSGNAAVLDGKPFSSPRNTLAGLVTSGTKRK